MRAAGALLAGGATLPFLVACGAQSSPDSQGQGAAPSGPLVELRVHGQGTSDGEGYDKNVAAFNQQFAGKYKAVHEQNTGDNYQKQDDGLRRRYRPPTCTTPTPPTCKHQEYAIKGIAQQLDSFISRDKNFKLNDWTPRAQDVMKIIDGKLFGMPIRGQVSWLFLYWNKDLLQRRPASPSRPRTGRSTT